MPRSARSRNSVDRPASRPGSSCFLSVAEVAVVRVPVAVVDGHAADAGLDQPPGHQARLAERVAAVLVAQLVGLGVDVERLLGLRRGHQVERLLLEDADGLGVAVGRAPRRPAGSGPRWRSSSLRSSSRSASSDGRRHDVGHGEVGGVGVGVDDERGGGGAEVGRAGAGVHLGQADVGRHGAARPELAGDDRRRGPAAGCSG